MKTNELVGAYKLVEGHVRDASGAVVAAFGSGVLHYAVSGSMGAQVAADPSSPDTATRRTLGEYVAYFGTYSVAEEEPIVHHAIEASNVPDYVGRTLSRRCAIDGRRLTLTADVAGQADVGAGVVATMIWEKVD